MEAIKTIKREDQKKKYFVKKTKRNSRKYKTVSMERKRRDRKTEQRKTPNLAECLRSSTWIAFLKVEMVSFVMNRPSFTKSSATCSGSGLFFWTTL